MRRPWPALGHSATGNKQTWAEIGFTILKPFLNFKDNSILITVHPATILLSYLYEA
jgi:hypothetical protein